MQSHVSILTWHPSPPLLAAPLECALTQPPDSSDPICSLPCPFSHSTLAPAPLECSRRSPTLRTDSAPSSPSSPASVLAPPSLAHTRHGRGLSALSGNAGHCLSLPFPPTLLSTSLIRPVMWRSIVTGADRQAWGGNTARGQGQG